MPHSARPADIDIVKELVARCDLPPVGAEDISPLAADGSQRVFYRVASSSPVIAVFPGAPPQGLAEASSCYAIGSHLAERGVAVPHVYGWDRHHGVVLLEDLGSCHLHDLVQAAPDFARLRPYYRQAVEALLVLQVDGRQGFDLSSCWSGDRYDFDLMIEKEANYFLNALCRDYLALVFEPGPVEGELIAIARQAACQPADYLLHRDFQCRNLLVHDERIRIIDFQGARLGPLGYDLASLLIDPYAGLSSSAQEEIFGHYLALARVKLGLDPENFRRGYTFLAIQRNLQILGAFAFLSKQRGKPFFAQFISPALRSLLRLLAQVDGDFLALTDLVGRCLARHEKS
ncbi:MAG: phosphotransferase [Thermodesulfobacteriota bacterium]